MNNRETGSVVTYRLNLEIRADYSGCDASAAFEQSAKHAESLIRAGVPRLSLHTFFNTTSK